jgi:hypothetical protein
MPIFKILSQSIFKRDFHKLFINYFQQNNFRFENYQKISEL